MKTAMQQLIDGLDPIHDGVKQLATKLLEVEENQLADAYLLGRENGRIDDDTSPSIYESPDKGKTVYKRKRGDYNNKIQIK